MEAVRIHKFGGLDMISYEVVSRPTPGPGQLLIKVKAAGVGPWDAWVRQGKSVVPHPLPLILGSDFSGVVENVGPGVSNLRVGEEVFGATNAEFTGAYAEYAVAEAGMVARKPKQLSYVQAASVPIVASTAWQMVFDHGRVGSGKRVLVHGAAGNVGAYAVQFAARAGAEVIGTAFSLDVESVRGLGATQVIDARMQRFEKQAHQVDVVLDTVGGEVLDRSFAILKPGGILVSSVSAPDQRRAQECGVRAIFFLVAVTTVGLAKIADLLESGAVKVQVGDVLPLAEARRAHEMLAGKAHKRGKIVLAIDGGHS